MEFQHIYEKLVLFDKFFRRKWPAVLVNKIYNIDAFRETGYVACDKLSFVIGCRESLANIAKKIQ